MACDLSGAVDETRQNTAYGCLLADKMNTPFNLPLLKFPGYLVNMLHCEWMHYRRWVKYLPAVTKIMIIAGQLFRIRLNTYVILRVN